MAIIGIAQEAPDSPKAELQLGKYVIVRRFKVQTSSYLDGPLTVVLAPGIPPLFSTYQFGVESNTYCRVRSVEPERIRPGSLWWLVTVTYETPDLKSGAGSDGLGGGGGSGGDSGGNSGGGTVQENDQQFQNPLAEYPEIATHFETSKEPIYYVQGLGQQCIVVNGTPTVSLSNTSFFTVGDSVTVQYKSTLLNSTISSIVANTSLTLANNWTGPSTSFATVMDVNLKPCQSSAGEVFVPPPNKDVSRLVLTITRNENILNNIVATSLAYQDAVNSDPFWGANPGQAKINSITAQRQNKQLPDGTTYPFLRVTYVIHFKTTWDTQLLDKGTYYLYQASGMSPIREQRFQTSDAQPKEGLLDGTGKPLARGANPAFITVRPYTLLPFAPLNLPTGFLDGVS